MIKFKKWFDNATIEGLPRARASLSEDVCGTPGYADYLEGIGDPTHPGHETMRLWGP
ncbi:IS1096 element passenger TnpR family protein [Bradyrhizobium sp. USDA 4461]